MRTTDDPMKGVELWPIDDGVLVANQHFSAVIEGVDHHGTSIAELDLKDGVIVLTPPFLADSGMVFAKLEEVTEYRNGARDFRQAFYIRDVGGETCLEYDYHAVHIHVEISC